MAGDNCPECPDEGLPGWMGTFADMMTLLFAFFVLMFSMATMDPVKYSAFSDAQADKLGGVGEDESDGLGGGSSEEEIKEGVKKFKEAGVTEIKGMTLEAYQDSLLETIKKKAPKSFAEIKEELEEILEEADLVENATIVPDVRGVTLEIEGDICFSAGKVNLKPELLSILDQAIENIMTADNDNRSIIVEGHTDSDPIPKRLTKDFATNWELSAVRASVVVNYLISKGVNPSRLSARGYAYQWPFSVPWEDFRKGIVTESMIAEMNDSEEKKSQNRRIKIIIGELSALYK